MGLTETGPISDQPTHSAPVTHTGLTGRHKAQGACWARLRMRLCARARRARAAHGTARQPSGVHARSSRRCCEHAQLLKFTLARGRRSLDRMHAPANARPAPSGIHALSSALAAPVTVPWAVPVPVAHDGSAIRRIGQLARAGYGRPRSCRRARCNRARQWRRLAWRRSCRCMFPGMLFIWRCNVVGPVSFRPSAVLGLVFFFFFGKHLEHTAERRVLHSSE